MCMQVLSLVLLQPLACLLGSPQFAPLIEYCHPTAHPSGFIYKLNMFSALDNILWISQGIEQRRKQYYSNQVNKQHMDSSCAGIWDLPTLKLSNSCFSKSWRWRAWFSSDIFSLLERICDCTRARVCIQRRVLATWCLIELPSTSVFNLARPRRALNALLACYYQRREVSAYLQYKLYSSLWVSKPNFQVISSSYNLQTIIFSTFTKSNMKFEVMFAFKQNTLLKSHIHKILFVL